jgi:hypothetical protein
LAQSLHVRINDEKFEELGKQEIKELFRGPNLPKSSQDVKREVEEYVEETEKQQKKLEELADEKLAQEIAGQLERIGINVRPGPARKDEILEALEGLADVVKVLEEVEDSEVAQEHPGDEQGTELNESQE